MAPVATPDQTTNATAVAATQTPTPERILDTFFGLQRAYVLRAAVDLDVFTAMADGPRDVSTIAKHADASERGIRILCDFLTVQNFLKKEDGKYSLTPESAAFLNRKSPMFLGSVGGFLVSDYVLDRSRAIKDSIKKGGTALEDGGATSDHPMWVEFAKYMAPMMALPAKLIAQQLGTGATKILDIAAGHGIYGIIVGQSNPNAKIHAVDWKNVVAYANENAQKMGVGDRYVPMPGSAFDIDFGTDFDIVLIPNFMHHFDAPTNIGFLKKVRSALKQGGRVAIAEFVPNDDRVSPPAPAAFSMTMLAGTPTGDAYTFAELRQMLEGAGFKNVSRHDLLPTPSTLVIGEA